MNKLKEWLMHLFHKKEDRIKLDLKIDPKPNIQRIFLDNYVELETHGWYIVRLDDTVTANGK